MVNDSKIGINEMESKFYEINALIVKYDNLFENEDKESMEEILSEIYKLAYTECFNVEVIEKNKEEIRYIQNFLVRHITYIRREITKIFCYNRIIDFLIEFSFQSLKNAKEYLIRASKMEKTPDYGKISIIVPIYKVETYLPKCIESILMQTYKNIEIILVDDGSPDSCGEICDEYSYMDNRIKVIHKVNGGLCSARNAGLKNVTGEYVGFVDSDDWCAPDMYEYLLNGIIEYNAQVATCRYFRVNENGITTKADGADIFYDNHDDMMAEFINHFVIRSTFWNKLFCKNVFEDKCFPEGRVYEGTYFMHDLLENVSRLILLGQPKYYYVDNGESIVRTRTLKNGMHYVYSYIKRYNDLYIKYPSLNGKLFDDVLKAIRSLSYIGYNASETEIKENIDDINIMCEFIRSHMTEINLLSKIIKYEILCLGNGNIRGFRMARIICGIQNKMKKVMGKYYVFKETISTDIAKSPYINVANLSQIQKANLVELQSVILEIILEIDRICKKHNLVYYIYGGTLLGAVRHKGFIPWDDDADIVMPRKDYEKFAKVCSEELGDKYFYQNCFNTPDFYMLFSKVCKNGTYVHEERWSNKNVNKGIFVDILPLDYFPKNAILGGIVLHFISFIHQVCLFEDCKSTKLIVKTLVNLCKKLPTSWFYRLRAVFLKAVNRFSSKENICSFGSHYQPMTKRVFKSCWFEGEQKYMIFENHELRVPSNWENYIIHLFGEDYMQLPPADARVCHTDLAKVNFNGNEMLQEEKKLHKYY